MALDERHARAEPRRSGRGHQAGRPRPDDDEVRTGNAMVIDCYGRIIRETSRAGDDVVIADLDASLRERCTGVRWIKARRPELYGILAQPTGKEMETRNVRFEYDDPTA